MVSLTMEKIVSLCKRRGFIFPGSEIYGGLSNTWDYGPLGAQLKKNVKDSWWKTFIESRPDMVGFDSAILMNPKVWEASGHVQGFTDPMVDCKNCKNRFRSDHLESDVCPSCGERQLTKPRQFNLMFQTSVGPMEDSANTVFLRPETAQGIFVNFKNTLDTTRRRLPFGIGQIGKAFRNEITPGNFIFRTLEFELMEIEYFIHPKSWEEHFEKWRGAMKQWTQHIGIDLQRTHDYEHTSEERAHYSKKTVDLEFDYPFGRKELWGLAYRTDYDLRNHAQSSGADFTYSDPVTHEAFIPHVIEPAFGVDRLVLALLVSVYHEEGAPTADGGEETRVVLQFPFNIAPYHIAVLPLSKKPELQERAQEVFHALLQSWRVEYDETQSIGKRYRRQDEIGTPFCVTVDFATRDDHAVTVRDRDSMQQERIPTAQLIKYFADKFSA